MTQQLPKETREALGRMVVTLADAGARIRETIDEIVALKDEFKYHPPDGEPEQARQQAQKAKRPQK